MELQIALDRIPLNRAVDITAEIAPRVDWIEMGTSLIKQFGQDGLRRIVVAAGATPVLADLKTVDDVQFEFALAFDAGARAVTILGLAPRVSLELAVDAASGDDRELLVDLMGLDEQTIAEHARWLPMRVRLAPHVSKDAQGTGQRAQDLIGPSLRGRRLAVAGGLTAEDLPNLCAEPDLRVIIGSAVTNADDPLAAVEALRHAAAKDNV